MIGTIPLFGRGDLGRTETFTQTDFGIRHTYNFGRDGKFRLIAELDVINLFDESNDLSLFRPISANKTFSEGDFGFNSGNASQDLVNFLQAFQTTDFSGQITPLIAAGGGNDPRYGLANTFQGPRSVRFGFRFIF